MRFIVAFALTLIACTANVAITKVPISQRVADACDELNTVCTTKGDCLPHLAFCGADGAQFLPLFQAEDSCKTGCGDDASCIRGCKLTRVGGLTSYLAAADLDANGTVGDGLSACSNLQQDCASGGTGCLAGEFFCTALAPAPGPCSDQLAMCKAACAPHDRSCLRKCRQQYQTCQNSGTADAGVPDAPTADAPTTITYDLKYLTDGTGTGTLTVNPTGTSCGASCYTYASGTSVTLTPTASAGSTFSGWTGCTNVAMKTNSCTVMMNQTTTVTATFTTTGYTYTTDIAPKMTGLCNGCHTGGSAPSGYLTDSYTRLFGNGSDSTPNIIAGDATSLFVQKIQGNHQNVLNQYPGFDTVAYDWVVKYNAAQ